MSEETNPFRATIGLRIDPAAAGIGRGLPAGDRARGAAGGLPEGRRGDRAPTRCGRACCGWQVTDCTVTITQSGFTPPPPFGWSKWSSSAGDFRNLTPLVLMSALRQAGTRVYEPVHRFHLEAPADTAGAVLPALARLGAVPGAPLTQGPLMHRGRRHPGRPGARAGAAAARPDAAARACSKPRSTATGWPASPVPVRARSDHNPLHREEYLLHVTRRAG